MSAASILRRLDRAAFAQLCEVAARQAVEIEQLREELATARAKGDFADECAQFWQEDALRFQDELADAIGGTRGLCIDGSLVVIAPDPGADAIEARCEHAWR